MGQCELAALLLKDLECIRRVIAAVDAIDFEVIGRAVDIVDALGMNPEGKLWVPVDTDVSCSRDSDGLKFGGGRGRSGSGNASEEGNDGELHDVCVGYDW